MKKSDTLRLWAIKKLGGYTTQVTNPQMFGIVERTTRYDMVPLRAQVAIRDRMMSVDEYAHTKRYLIEQAKRQLVEAAEPFFIVNEDFKDGVITLTLNVYNKA